MPLFLRNILNLREGEERKTFFMFTYIFLIIASLVLMKPIRTSLFIEKYGIHQLPYVFVFVALTAIIFAKIYPIFSNKIRLNTLIVYTHLFFITQLIFFWILLTVKIKSGWFLYVFFVWVAIYGVVICSQFWLLANYVFNAREAKRIFSILAAGGISGGIFGGYLDSWLATIIGSNNMLVFCLVFWIMCIFILNVVWKESARYNYKESIAQQKRISYRKFQKDPVALIFRSQHLIYIAVIVGLGALISALVDYQYASIAVDNIEDKDELTAFFGFWLSNLSIASLIFQFFLTGRILKKFGVTTSLFFLPFGILVGTFCLFLNPVLWAAILIKLSEGSFKQSINKSGLELLYFPVSSLEKNQAKAFIDVSVDGYATGFGGVLLVICANLLGFTIPQISILVMSLIILWIYLILKDRKEYINSFRKALEKRTIDLADQNLNINDAAVFESITRVFEGKNERQILYALQLLENINNPAFISYYKKLLYHPSSEIKLQVLKNLQQVKDVNLSEQVKQLLADSDSLVRVDAVRYIILNLKGDIQVLNKIFDDSDIKTKGSVLLGIAYEYKENKQFRDKIDIKKLIDDYLIESSEINLSEEEKIYIKVHIAKVLGILKEEELNTLLYNYLYDSYPEVIRTAVESVGKTKNPMFISALVHLLDRKDVRKQVREALAAYEDEVIDDIDNFLKDSKISVQIRMNLIKVLSLIGSQRSVEVLLNYLDNPVSAIGFHAIKSLNVLRTKFTMLSFTSDKVEKQLWTELRNYQSILNYFISEMSLISSDARKVTKDDINEEVHNARQLLVKALAEKMDTIIEKMFRILGLKYPPDDIYNAYIGIFSERPILKANAIEFLDNILSLKLKESLIPILETYSKRKTLNKYPKNLKAKILTEPEVLNRLIQVNDSWLTACALFLIAKNKSFEHLNILEKLTRDPDSRVSESAIFAIQNIKDHN